jgi:sigma-B regulation protein RsbQ
MSTALSQATAFLLLTVAAAAAVQTGSINSSDGVRIVYDVRGKGDTTLVFVHCWSCDRSFWRNQVDAFADQYSVVTLDLAGHGESGKNRKTWTVPGLAEDVRALADKLKLQKMILVGHSMGGPVSLEAARLLRGRVIGVIAVDTLQNAELQMSMAMIQPIADKLKADFAGAMGSFMGSMFAKSSDPALREWVEKKAKAANPTVAVALMLDFANLDFRKLFAGAGVPIRAINAQSSSAPTTVEVNRKYADYDAILMNDVGHFLQLERPKEFNEHLSKFAAALANGPQRSATHVSNDDVQGTLKRAPENSVSDQQIRVVDVGKVNVGIGAVYRSAKATQAAVEHDQMTEVYHIIEGSGTLVTGGTIVNPQRRGPDHPSVRDLNGPSVNGTALQNGESRRVGPGDVVVIPAGVGHWFSAVDGSIRYLVVRVDADKIMRAK